MIPVLHYIYVLVTLYIVHTTPSIVTVVYASINPVPVIVITASSVNLPDVGVTLFTIGTELELYDAALLIVVYYYPLTVIYALHDVGVV